MKKRLRMIMLITLVGIIGVLMVYGNKGEEEGNELTVTSVVYNGTDVTAQMDLERVAEIVGGASISKNKHENAGEAQWVIQFEMDGVSWTMELGVSDGDIDRTYSAEGKQYKVKNGDDVINQLLAELG